MRKQRLSRHRTRRREDQCHPPQQAVAVEAGVKRKCTSKYVQTQRTFWGTRNSEGEGAAVTAKKPRLPALDSIRFFLIAYIGVGHFIACATRETSTLAALSQVNVVVGAFFELAKQRRPPLLLLGCSKRRAADPSASAAVQARNPRSVVRLRPAVGPRLYYFHDEDRPAGRGVVLCACRCVEMPLAKAEVPRLALGLVVERSIK